MNDYKNESEDEHGWVNPAVSLSIWIGSIAAIGVVSIIIYCISL